eukprot:CAMPEP_0182863318 /NCGR_PEP_ID=MMETSP0034_2-20130328/6579_1 /TAXON_ID=156128 /ORGANISM="Nephroselmis pyriformis, Strain CCMP717" /LENGTH=247 /DNA_ID=CAMNT_0024995513 /DNA_START=87 /DNA_END=826 /DNA_ORIENTATION=+
MAAAAANPLDVLQKELASTKAEFDSWAAEKIDAVESMRQNHEGVREKREAEVKVLREKAENMETFTSEVKQKMKEQDAELKIFKGEVEASKKEEEALPDALLMLRDQVEKHSQEVQKEYQGLQEEAAANEQKLDAFTRVVDMYKARLGLRVEQAGAGDLAVVFTLLDPADHDREFKFFVRVSGGGGYSVSQCEPRVEGLEGMVEEVNASGNVSQLVRSMRQAFRAGLGLTDPLPCPAGAPAAAAAAA